MSTSAFDVKMWQGRSRQYSQLGWVQSDDLLQPFIEVATGMNFAVGAYFLDIGMGSGAVLKQLAQAIPDGIGIGFDISSEMLTTANGQLGSAFIADAYNIPLSLNSIQLATMRMVLHHLCDGHHAVSEMVRVLNSGGIGIIAEYVVPGEALEFEKGVFEIKEPGRRLWTPELFSEFVLKAHPSIQSVDVITAIMRQYSVKDWMGKSGLPIEVQDGVLQCYLSAPPAVVDSMGITITDTNDALVDRPFSYIVFTKI